MNESIFKLLQSDKMNKWLPKDKDAHNKVALGYYFGFFFANGYEKEKRARAALVAQDYWDLCGKELKWMTHPRNFNWRKIPKDYNLSDWLSKYPQDDWVWQMIFHGGRVKTEASSYMITGLGNSRQTFSTSYLYLHVPLDWFLNNPSQDPTTLYIRWAEMMQAEHGTAGIGLIPAKDEIIKGETSRFAAEFSRIFPGAELCDPLSQSGKVLKGLLSVNWLNQINDHYIKELGGTEKIKHELQGTNAKIYLYDGGAVIAAGPQAELCEENELTIIPKSYQVAAKLLKPLRTTYGWGFWGANNENVLEWLARFDTK